MNSPDPEWRTHRFPWQEVASIQIAPAIAYRGEALLPQSNFTGAHPFYTWWWLLEGEVRVSLPGHSVRLHAGEWVLIPAGMVRTQRFRPGSRLISLNFTAQWPDGLPLVTLERALTGDGRDAPGLKAGAEAVCRAFEVEEGPGHLSLSGRRISLAERLELAAALARFAGILLDHAALHGGRITPFRERDRRLEFVLESLRNNLRAGPLPFRAWREATGLGRSQLDRLARGHLKMSLHAYRDRLLAAEAYRRLAAPSALVKQVAEALGFVDTAHFCRWFRRQTRRSPAQAREAHP